MFQFTHPRGVRLRGVANTVEPRRVSIHAPARGATRNPAQPTRRADVSIHAPARGATQSNETGGASESFQFTHPRGVRLMTAVDNKYSVHVSIHAPARGATRLYLLASTIAGFQFTHPRGVRRAVAPVDGDALLVSIHAPTRGATGREPSAGNPPVVSIHAPTRGATQSLIISSAFSPFQFTHPRGVRRRPFGSLF